MLYDVATLLPMAPIDPWQNCTPFFGALAFCRTKIEDFENGVIALTPTVTTTTRTGTTATNYGF